MRLSDLRNSATFRLTAALGLVFLVSSIVLLSLTYFLTEREQTRRSDAVLIAEAQRLIVVKPSDLPAAVRNTEASSASGLNYFSLMGQAGELLSGNLALRGPVTIDRPFELPSGTAAPVPLRVLVKALPDGRLLAVGRDITPTIDLRRRLLTITVVTGLVVIVSASMAAVLLSLGLLRRVQGLKFIALRIAAGELDLRMPVSGRHDELDLIAITINAMIQEIGRLMEQVKGATDAIAHDLRTPLSQLRFRLQALRDQPPSEGSQVRPIVADAIAELDDVLTRFTALLRISELEAAGRKAGFGRLDPMTLLTAAGELYEPLAEERGIEWALHGAYGHMVDGDETLLFEAIGNLLENAIKFTRRDGAVSLSVVTHADDVCLEVRDNGPGIAPMERESVLRRFQRGAAAQHVPGSGLGLSLVAAIVHLHGFELEMEDAKPGLLVRIKCWPAKPVNL
jgi:signal transduction histidine kinase